MPCTLLFLEFPGDSGRFADQLAAPDMTVVALTPHMAHELRELGIAFRYPEDFADWRKQEEAAIGELNDLLLLCADADKMLHDLWPSAKERAFEPFRSAFYELHLFRGSIWTKLYRCRATIDALAPTRVVYPTLPPKANDSDPMSFDERSLYAEVVRHLCVSRAIEHSEIVAPISALDAWKHEPQPAPPSERASSLARLIGGKLRQLIPRGKRRPKGPRVLMVQRLTSSNALQRRADVTFWDEVHRLTGSKQSLERNGLPAAVLETWWIRLRTDPDFRRFFQLGETNWFALAEAGFEHFVKRLVPSAWATLEEAEVVLDSVNPDAAVFGNISAIDVHTIARAALRRGIPVITEPHGPFGHFVNYVCTLFDAMASTHYLVPGEGCIEFNDAYGRYPMVNVVTGSTLIDAARRDRIDRAEGLRSLGLQPDRPTVMVVIQAVLSNWEYGPYSGRDDRRSYESQLRILQCLADFSEIQVLLKGHPAVSRPMTPLVAVGRKILGDRFAHVAGWRLWQMLDMADCFVMDYAVTTIYEALTTEKKIYALKDFYDVFPPAEGPLRNCADFFDDVGSLTAALRRDLSNGVALQPDRRRTQDFMHRYGDPFGDGRAEERVAEAIVTIARGGRGRNSG